MMTNTATESIYTPLYTSDDFYSRAIYNQVAPQVIGFIGANAYTPSPALHLVNTKSDVHCSSVARTEASVLHKMPTVENPAMVCLFPQTVDYVKGLEAGQTCDPLHPLSGLYAANIAFEGQTVKGHCPAYMNMYTAEMLEAEGLAVLGCGNSDHGTGPFLDCQPYYPIV